MAENDRFKLDQDSLTMEIVIKKIHDIADDQYEGKVYDNILTIFNTLTTKEKRVYLRGLVNICYIIESSLSRHASSHADVRSDIGNEIRDINALNEAENIKLKTWLMKMIASVVLLGLTGLMIFLFVFNGDKNGMLGSLSTIVNLFKLLFGSGE